MVAEFGGGHVGEFGERKATVHGPKRTTKRRGLRSTEFPFSLKVEQFTLFVVFCSDHMVTVEWLDFWGIHEKWRS